jgi:hypothetical protein
MIPVIPVSSNGATVAGAVAATILLVALPTIASAQHVNSDLWVTNGTVNATALAGDTLYMGGLFTYVGPRTGGGAPIATSGAPLSGFPKVHGIVRAVAADGSGGWFIGGGFDSVGSVARANLAHIRSDLTVAPSPNANGEVRALAVSGSTVYVGGDFTFIGGLTRNYIAALDATTGVATNWIPNASAAVHALVVSGSFVYAGGFFTTMGDSARSYVAALDASTGIATSWKPNPNSVVYALAVGGSVVYVGGAFTSIAGQTRNYIAGLNASDGLATAFSPNANSYVYALAVSGSTVYAGGGFAGFNSIGGQTRNNIAALDAATGLATSWDPNPNQSSVNALVVSGSTVYAGGGFARIGGQDRNRVAALDASTGLATSWDPNADFHVFALAASGPTVYVGGQFASIGGKTRSYVASLDLTTGRVTSWNPNADNGVFALTVSGPTVLVGGYFTIVGGQSRTYIAALDRTSGLATSWSPNADGYVYALAVSGSRVYAGGSFFSIGGQSRLNIAALDAATGLAATSWNPNANSGVYALAVSGSTVYAGGGFTGIGGQTRSCIAALDAAGTGLATGWDPNASNTVYALAVSGSIVYAAGSFISIGGQSRSYIAALGRTSGLATSWNPSSNGYVQSLALGGSTIYAGGSFTTMGGVTGRGIAAVSAVLGVSRALPAEGGDAGRISVVLLGIGFQSSAVPKLSRSGQADIVGTAVTIAADGDSVATIFDLTGKAQGTWDVIVTNPDASFAILAQGFTISSLQAPQLRVDVIGPALIRYNRRTAFDLVIDNPGNVDALAASLWISGVPLGGTVELDFPLGYPPQAGGEPDWSTVPLDFSSPGGRYVPVVIPRVPPGTTARRIYVTVPPSVSSFKLLTAVTPSWVDGNKFRNCLTSGGVITAPACMGAQLTAINSFLAGNPQLQALSGIGVWAKIAWQCEGATTFPLALTRAEQVLDYMVGPVELPGSQTSACSDVLPPRWRDSLLVTIVGSIDPNDKLGARDTLAVQQAIPYSIRFENLSTATAPAQQVVVADPLNVATLDPSTVSLDVITFGNIHIVPPPGLRSYATQVDLRPSRNLLVNVNAAVDPFTGVLTWYFTSIDPATGQPPTDPLAGFLPPNQTPPEGEGSVLFTVMPRSTLASGTQISNGATIVFDDNAPLNTGAWINTVDDAAPASHVLPLAVNSDLPSVPVSWTATGGPQDLRDFTVYLAEDGGPYRVWRLNTSATNDTLMPPGDHRIHHYALYSVARDVRGNIEAAPGGPDASTQSRTEVGDATGLLQLALEGARPNPALGVMQVWFTLPSREAATLDVVDIAGRRVIWREVGPLGPGAHSLTLDDSPPLRPGIYFLRLAQGRRVLSTRVALIQ